MRRLNGLLRAKELTQVAHFEGAATAVARAVSMIVGRTVSLAVQAFLTSSKLLSQHGHRALLHTLRVQFTPTVEHCSMATLIGLCIRVKLLRCLPTRFKVDIQVGTCTGGGGAGCERVRVRICVYCLHRQHISRCTHAFMHSCGARACV
jgi:hypothetical protein